MTIDDRVTGGGGFEVLRADIARVERRVESETATLRDETATLRDETATLREETTALREETTALRRDVAGLRADGAALRAEMNRRFDLQDSKFMALHEQLDAKINLVIELMQAGFERLERIITGDRQASHARFRPLELVVKQHEARLVRLEGGRAASGRKKR